VQQRERYGVPALSQAAVDFRWLLVAQTGLRAIEAWPFQTACY